MNLAKILYRYAYIHFFFINNLDKDIISLYKCIVKKALQNEMDLFFMLLFMYVIHTYLYICMQSVQSESPLYTFSDVSFHTTYFKKYAN